MIDIQNSNGRNHEKTFPGCLGSMVNLLDLGTGTGGNKLLTTKPHRDGDQLGSTLSRSRSDVARMSRSIEDTGDDKLILSDLRNSSNMKLNRTPIKMLIAQEMSNDLKSNHSQPSLVAKLMGLDNLPHQQSDSFSRQSHSRSYSTSTITNVRSQMDFWQHGNNFLEERMQHNIHQCSEQTEYKDVYEISQQSKRSNSTRDTSPRKGINQKDTYEKKMALVRQKFTEAKSLATDEKLRQSKEFQDALEVLSANRDLFIKFLQEPNALLSKHTYDFDVTPPAPGTKRITILKPSMMLDNDKISRSTKKCETQTRKPYQMGTANDSHLKDVNDIPSPPTRIVVLKPSPSDTHEYKSVASPYSSSPRTVHGDCCCEKIEDDEVRNSRDVAKEITLQACGDLSGDHSDETVLSSVCSNGYIGDESSFHKSKTEYAVENLSDSEVITPTSRHSWDYINRFNTPFSPSSFSRTSCSPESSVGREAKKRLSERWAMLALNGNSHEKTQIRRSCSTLGEMLALSETPKSANNANEEINKDEESRIVSCSSSNLNKECIDGDESRNFLRSKSVPIFLTEHGVSANGQLVEFPDRKELTKVKSLKSSFKGKVSSLFFSRNKASNKNKSQSTDESQAATSEPPVTLLHNLIYGDGVTQRVNECNIKEALTPCLHPSSRGEFGAALRQGIASEKGTCENFSENQEPSPVSVLESLFQEDDNTPPVSSGTRNSMISNQSNLIGKSPRIGSIARTLSGQDDPTTVTTTPLNPEKEQDWRILIHSLLSLAGLDGNMSSESLICRWHSSESAINPILREIYIETDGTKFAQDAHRRQLRSSRKLVFDCVNAALMDLTTYDVSSPPILVDKVWSWLKPSSYDELKCNLSDDEDGNDLIVEMTVRKEVAGKMWSDRLASERENIEREIEKTLIEELVEESLVELYR